MKTWKEIKYPVGHKVRTNAEVEEILDLISLYKMVDEEASRTYPPWQSR